MKLNSIILSLAFTSFSNVLFQLQDPVQETKLHFELFLFSELFILKYRFIGSCKVRGTRHPIFLNGYILHSSNTVSARSQMGALRM